MNKGIGVQRNWAKRGVSVVPVGSIQYSMGSAERTQAILVGFNVRCPVAYCGITGDIRNADGRSHERNKQPRWGP